jgi:nitrogen fixation protein FixH
LYVLGLCVTVGGCTRTEDGAPNEAAQSTSANQSSSATSQGLAIEFRSQPDPPTSGENTFDVMVKQPDGSPVTDATVTTVFSMPAMPSMNMPAMRDGFTLTHQGEGRYHGTRRVSMAGTWNVVVTVSRDGQEIGSKRFSLIAKN